jgi:uncharacterized RDD family membrane protein YckC
MLAWLLDLAVVSILTMGVSFLLGLVAVFDLNVAMALSALIYFAISIGYSIYLEWMWNGQTLGKRIMRLRVVEESGYRLRFSQIVIRNLLRFVDSFPIFYFVGGITVLLSPRTQRLGDIAAGTLVVRQPRARLPDVEGLIGGKYNSFRSYPSLEARLCSLISPREVSIAVSALLRCSDFEDRARLEVFHALAAHFQSMVCFPPEVSENISDEQFVRNVVSSVYKRGERRNEGTSF